MDGSLETCVGLSQKIGLLPAEQRATVTEEVSSTSLLHVLQQLRSHSSCTRYSLHDGCVLQRTGSRGRVPIRYADAGQRNVSVHQQYRCSGIRKARHLLQRWRRTAPHMMQLQANNLLRPVSQDPHASTSNIVMQETHSRGSGKCSIHLK